MNLSSGGFRLFRLFGIDVSVHWLWALVAIYGIQMRRGDYDSIAWPVAEYLALFAIVLMHEFGHALACRSVGGRADRILLWPLGGIAFVQPPPRAGAMLWSIVAGPLVNVLLFPLLTYAYIAMAAHAGHAWWPPRPTSDFEQFVLALAMINLVLLLFNLLPIYPLDGGQILRSLLWFVVGPAQSLLIASIIGLAGAALGVVLSAVVLHSGWLTIMAAYAAFQSWLGLKRARVQARILALPRHFQAHCPSCHTSPPAVPTVRCRCGQPRDPFVMPVCPACGQRVDAVQCVHCGEISPVYLWTGVRFSPVVEAAAAPGTVGQVASVNE